MTTAKQNIKSKGQVYTPKGIVDEMLDELVLNREELINKHIIDNSCGDGAFLCQIVNTILDYFTNYIDNSTVISQIKDYLETYIHGIEKDKDAYEHCIKNLNDCISNASLDLGHINWDIQNKDALLVHDYDNKMDFVVGNPPYVRVHNLDDEYNIVKQYSFAQQGMVDLYIPFFELGFNMLKDGGKLCYITPNSWLYSVAGKSMRQYIMKNKNLLSIIDYAHKQIFDNITTYSVVSLFEKGKTNNKSFEYIYWDKDIDETKRCNSLKVINIKYKDSYIDDKFYLGDEKQLYKLKSIFENKNKYIKVKNGLCTNADSIFIAVNFPFKEHIISCLKASTGEWKNLFYPYDENSEPLDEDSLFKNEDIKNYFLSNKDKLLKRNNIVKEHWFLYGRSQALKDVKEEKIAINTLIKSLSDIKLNFVGPNEGIYSGLYIIATNNLPHSYINYSTIEKIIKNPKFIEYLQLLHKYKNGGYYTFNAKDLELYLNYELSDYLNTLLITNI